MLLFICPDWKLKFETETEEKKLLKEQFQHLEKTSKVEQLTLKEEIEKVK